MLEIVRDIAQSTHGYRNIFADIRNVPTRPHTVLGIMFLLAFSVSFTCCTWCSGKREPLSIIKSNFDLEAEREEASKKCFSLLYLFKWKRFVYVRMYTKR